MAKPFIVACVTGVLFAAATVPVAVQSLTPVEYRVLATNRTGTMEKELNLAAEAGFQFRHVMGGETAVGGKEVVAVMTRSGNSRRRVTYKLVATNRTSTMQRELQAASDDGFEFRGQTIFESMFGGKELACIMERTIEAPVVRYEYLVVATTRTSTLQRELQLAGDRAYDIVAMTVAETAVGGAELVSILRRPAAR